MAQPLLYHYSVLCCRVHSTLVYCPEFRKEKLCIPCNSVLEMPCSFMYPCLTKPRSVAGSSAAFLPSFSSKLSVFVPYLFLTVTFLNVTTPPRENQPRLFKHLLFFLSSFSWPRPCSHDTLSTEALQRSFRLSTLIQPHFAVGAPLLSTACPVPQSASGPAGWRWRKSGIMKGVRIWQHLYREFSLGRTGVKKCNWWIFVFGALMDPNSLF